MGEIIKATVNTLGWMTLLAGFLANLDNIISVFLGAVAFAFGVYKVLDQKEVWLTKKVDRKTKERNFKYNRTIQEEEEEELEKYKPNRKNKLP